MSNVISYKPAPTVKEFILDYRPGELFYDWIIGPYGCLPADSEYLTPFGWKRMDAYELGDSIAVYDGGEVSFECAEHVRLPASESFIRFDSGSLEMELSPEHRVLYSDYRGVERIATAAECAEHPSRRTIPTAFTLDRADAGLSDAEIRLRVAFSADGHIPKRGFQQFIVVRKERKKIRLRQLLQDAEVGWAETTYEPRPTETKFAIRWPEANKSLDFVWGLSSRQLAIVLDECLRWDGSVEYGEKQYFSTIRKHADAIQFAAHACGYRATISIDPLPKEKNWSPAYRVRIRVNGSSKNRAMVRAETRITRVEARDGMKYCFSTSTGFFVARCNGKIFITGNSGKTTGLFFKLVYMAGKQNPGPDGIRRSRAVVVRNTAPQLRDTTLVSWSFWFKDGQAGRWYETDKRFVLRFGDVECEVLFRPLDTPDDVARVLSLEVTFVLIDEFVQIPRQIVDALSARLGRYPPSSQGGATNWGMWGSSNPDTEDNWWYEHLTSDPEHVERIFLGEDENVRQARRVLSGLPAEFSGNAHYYHQPSGLGDEAENLEYLPGGRGYYSNQVIGKTEAWIKQFVEAEWGFSVAGQPVVSSFKPDLHISKGPLRCNPLLPLVVGFDPGLVGSALVFGQQDHHGRLLILGELVQSNYGAQRLIRERLKPYINRRFPNAKIVVAPDPAAASRAGTDERTVVSEFSKHYDVKVETNNRLPLRLDAIDHFATLLTDVGPALQIDEKECPMLVRALKGGWRFSIDTKKEIIKSPEPEKNAYSHVGDASGYLCRFFYRQTQRELRYSGVRKPFVPPRTFSSGYHFR